MLNNTDTMSTTDLANAFAALTARINAAYEAGRSVSTMNRLWQKYFRLEDGLKGRQGGW
jgi:hypothetical protein